jgi:hypothetical protein
MSRLVTRPATSFDLLMDVPPFIDGCSSECSIVSSVADTFDHQQWRRRYGATNALLSLSLVIPKSESQSLEKVFQRSLDHN